MTYQMLHSSFNNAASDIFPIWAGTGPVISDLVCACWMWSATVLSTATVVAIVSSLTGDL
jgi:hypothetical protein